jgi:hypothetical protein
LLGKLVTARDFVDYELSRTKAHENSAYLSSIRQVRYERTQRCYSPAGAIE